MAKAKKIAKGKAVKKKAAKAKPVKKATAKKVKKSPKKVKAVKKAKKVTKVAKKKVAKTVKTVKKATKKVAKKVKKQAKPAAKKVKKIAKKAVKKAKKVAKTVVEKVKKAQAPKPVEEKKPEQKVTKPEKTAPKPVPELHNFPVINQRPIAHTPAKKTPQDDRTRYSDEELKEFEELINRKLATARDEFKVLKDTLNRTNDEGTDSTSGGNTKVLEDGAETAEKENLSQLAARQLKYITNLENALIRIKNGTYGICSVTGKLISKERLIAVPHTTQSIEAKMMKRD